MRLDQHRRPGQPVARPQRLAPHEPRLDPAAAEKDRRHQRHLDLRLRPRRLRRAGSVRSAARPTASASAASMTSGASPGSKPNRARCAAWNAARIAARLAEGDRQRGVRALDLQVQRPAAAGSAAAGTPCASTSAAAADPSASSSAAAASRLSASSSASIAWRPRRPDVGEPHAVGREQRGHRMDQAGPHPQRVGDGAGVLRPRAAEHRQAVARDVVARAAR